MTWNEADKASKWYSKKRPKELAAVLRNLERYLELLNGARNARAISAGFLHFEPGGVVAIDQKGVPGLQETRLYTYAHQPTQTLYLITVGNKQQQSNDIKFSKDFASSF